MSSLFCMTAPIVRISSEVTSVMLLLLSFSFSRPLCRKACVLLLMSLNQQEVLLLSTWACYFLLPLEHPLITRTSLSLAASQPTSSACFSLAPWAVQEVGFWGRGLGGQEASVCVQRRVCTAPAVFSKGERV